MVFGARSDPMRRGRSVGRIVAVGVVRGDFKR
jgi:hypothetical protein